ncbi:MAG: PH domain-containing protein [Actinobacteria bacterium]|nr:PH domain-containing protein [Actinomycetota bacterium]
MCLPRRAGPEYRSRMAFPRRLLADHEELVLDLRPHWIALVPPALVTILIVGVVVAGFVVLPDSWPGWTRLVIVAIGLAAFAVYPLRAFVAWVTSHFVVTTDRLIHRSGWFAKQSMEIPLENINDVRFNQSVFERMIGAGDLRIESAGEFGQQLFTDIRDPERVQKTIYEVGEENQRRTMRAGRSEPSVADELDKLDQLRRDGVISEDEFRAQKSRLLGRA